MPQIAAAIAGTIEHSDAGLAIFEIAQRLKAPASLRTLGLARDKFEALTREVVHRTTTPAPGDHRRPPQPSTTRSKHDGAIGGRLWRQT